MTETEIMELLCPARSGLKALSAEAVKKLPCGSEVELHGRDKYGEHSWLIGKVLQSGKSKVFGYFGHTGMRETKPIREYPNKVWAVKERLNDG